MSWSLMGVKVINWWKSIEAVESDSEYLLLMLTHLFDYIKYKYLSEVVYYRAVNWNKSLL